MTQNRAREGSLHLVWLFESDVVLCERTQRLPLFIPFHLGQSQNWDVNIEGASCLARPDASPGPRSPKDALHRSKCASLVPSLCHNIPFGLLASWSSLTFDRKVILMDPPNGESSRFDLRSVGPGFEASSEQQSERGSCAVAAFTGNCHIYTAPGRRFPRG